MASEQVLAMRGSWRLPDSSVVVSISIDGDEVQVLAVDSDDGEELRVEELFVDEQGIEFYLVTPSTRWTVHMRIEPRDNGSLHCVTTLVDFWERIS